MNAYRDELGDAAEHYNNFNEIPEDIRKNLFEFKILEDEEYEDYDGFELETMIKSDFEKAWLQLNSIEIDQHYAELGLTQADFS